MLVVYDSKTGNVERFIAKLVNEGFRCVKISEDMVIDEPYVLITYTTGFGNCPPKVLNFLEKNHAFLEGVASSGNKNWGLNYGKSADTISQMYNVPIIHKFELSGTPKDIQYFTKRMGELR